MRKYRHYERWFHPLRFLHTLPLSHVFGQFMGLWLPPLLAGEVHFENRLEAERIVRTLRRERITVLAAVPRLLDLLRSYLAVDPQILQASSGESVWRRLWRFRRVHRRLAGSSRPSSAVAHPCRAISKSSGTAWASPSSRANGMTETAALVTMNHPFRVSRGSIGKPLPGREVRISPEVKSPSVARWFRPPPGSTANSSRDRTLGLPPETSPPKTAPAISTLPAVEAALLRQPHVTACAVVPLTVGDGGQEPAAVLVAPAGPESAAAAVLVANAELAGYQQDPPLLPVE